MDAVELTQALVRMNSVNPPGEEDRCARHAGGLLEDAGFAVSYHQYAPSRTSLVAMLPGTGEDEPLCFTGHFDTVPLGAAEWTADPFGAEIKDGKLFGRGSSDMKSGVAAMIAAAVEIARLPRQRTGLVLILTAGEETGCDGARHLARMGNVLPKAGALVVGEPTGNIPLVGHKGALWLRACYTGRTAHGSMPEQGDNAIYKAARGLLQLEHHRFGVPGHSVLGSPTLNVGTVKGGLNVNSVPDRAEFGIDIRSVPPQENGEIVLQLLETLGADATLERIVDLAPVASNPQNEWISDVFDLCEHHSGTRITPGGAPFFTDAAELVPAMGNPPTLILGPGEMAMAHKTDEYCLTARIQQAVDIYRTLALRWGEA